MKNLIRIPKINNHSVYGSLKTVIEYKKSGAYIIIGFEKEYGGETLGENAILLLESIVSSFIISPSKGILVYNDVDNIWEPVTRLVDEKIPLADLAEAVLKDADNSVKTSNITDKAVTREKIADGAISTAQIAEKGIGGSRLNDKTITTNKIADKAVTRAILNDAVVNQIDQFQMIPQGADLLNFSLGKGVYFTADEKYINIPTGITGYNPMCMIVDANGSRMLFGTAKTGDFICARKNSGGTSWIICNYYNEIQIAVSPKQNSTDNTLTTTAKTIVGAINEVNASIGNISSVLTNIIGE